MSIRIAHASDLHYASHTLAQVDRCFSFTVTAAIEQDADVVVVSGDATDHALEAHTPAYGALAASLRRLADHCPVLLLQGTFSHEPPGTLDVFRYLGGRYPIHVADRIEQVALTQDRLRLRLNQFERAGREDPLRQFGDKPGEGAQERRSRLVVVAA